jgi:DUF4097 and DUF4098 domain-containing protein YvlB
MTHTKTFVLALLAISVVSLADTAIDEVRTAGPKDNVEISNVKGRVEVEGWDKNEVRVTGTLGKNVERLEFQRDGDDTEIRVVVPRGGWRVGESNLVIRLPFGNEVRVECVSGSVEAKGIRADVELETVSGSVRVTDCEGAIEAQSTSGSVKVLQSRGDVNAETVSGSVEVEGDFGEVEANSASGSVHVRTVRDKVRAASISGSVEVEGVAPRDVECESNSGSVSYTGGLAPNAKLRANTHSGSVKLRLPADVSARVHAQTFSGGINNQLSGAEAERPKNGPGATLNTKFGDGSADIEASAFSGSVTLGTK